jgi:NAD(P)-dependent dehydrogenase (short-subunit alcohol dehydrogenase family)
MPTPTIHAFAEKVAVITDGANPIGRAVALQLALQGSYVIVAHSGASPEGASALGELKSLGTLASVVEADASTESGAEALIAAAASTFGRIDLLVDILSAGPGNEGSVRRVIDKAHGLLVSRPKPKVVMVVEDGGKETAVSAVTVELAASLPPKFRVNAVVVGERFDDAARGLDPELFPPRSGIDPDDVARVVVFLLSGEAIGLNGQSLKVGR